MGVRRDAQPDSDSDPKSDQSLLGAYASGDVRAFEVLYARHKEFVIRVARRFARDESEALDVFQEAFTRLVAHAPKLKVSGKLSTWMYPVVRNLIAERRRKQSGLRLAQSGAEAEVRATAAAPTDTNVHATLVQQRLARLPDEQREVVILRIVEGLSVEEVALALDVPEGTIKSRLHNALRTLQGPG